MNPNVTRGVALPLLFTLALAACSGGGSKKDAGNGGNGGSNPPPVAQPGSLQLSVGSLSIDETAGTATFEIMRTGGSDGAVSVTLASSDGSANAAQDYAAVNSTINFAAGDTSKTATLSITDDDSGELDETLALALSSPTGGATLGATRTATVTITDNDPPDAPVLVVGADIKQLTFNWAGAPAAASYRLLQDPDGHSGFTRVGADLATSQTSTSIDVAVHLHDWQHAAYQLQACNSHGCRASSAQGSLSAMLQSIGYFKASNTDALDSFGSTVAVSADGSTVAVGAVGESSSATGVDGDQSDETATSAGAVYVFVRTATRTWAQQAYLKASNAGSNDVFGAALALSADGNTLVVSAVGEDSSADGINGDQLDNGAATAGAVYVFVRSGSSWTQQAYLKASNSDVNDRFGDAVSLSDDGDTLAVGAASEDSNATGINGNQLSNAAGSSGAVYVFSRIGTSWSQQAYIKASNTQRSDFFGTSVALNGNGDVLAVGASGEASAATGVGGDQTNNDAANAGAVFMFSRTGAAWSQQAYVKASNTEFLDSFGTQVALNRDGNVLAVSATGENSSSQFVGGNQLDDSAPGAGAVYVFTRSAAVWSQQEYIKASNAEADDFFGSSLSLSDDGNLLAVGAYPEASGARGIGGSQGDNSAADAGAVYVFARNGGAWSQHTYVKAPNSEMSDTFGNEIALSGDGNALVVGAPNEAGGATGIGGNQALNGALDAGAAYIF